MAQNTPGKQLFDLLVTRGFDPEILDSSGKAAPSAEDAEIYSFEFVSSGGTNYGTVVVMLGDEQNLELFSGDNVGRGMDSEDKTEWYEFQHQLKNFATKNFMTFGSQNINRLKYSMQGQAALKEGLFESWNGTKNVSWNGGPDSVRLMIRHKRPMGVNEARFRQVESLFLETAEGECYKLPFRNLSGGRAMVEHVRQGGKPYDMRGQHIANMVEELNVLSRFRRASHGRVFEGDTANLVNETNVYHATMSRTLKGLASSRGYNSYFESWNPADITEQDVIIEDIKTLFVQETIDSRIEQALPILARIQQQGTAMKEANIFEAWAENLLEGTWATPNTPEQQQKLIALLSQELPVGADATNATTELYSLVGDDILFDQLQDLAEQDPDADCRSLVIARISDMASKGFDDFDTVLDALKSEQLAPATVAPEAPVAEQDDEEYSVDGGMNNELLQDDYALESDPIPDDQETEYDIEPPDQETEYDIEPPDQETELSRLRELSGMDMSQQGVTEGLHPMIIDDVKKLATLSPTDRYSAYSNIRGYFKADPTLSKMASDLMGGYYEADMLRGKYKTAEAKAKYAELEPMNQAFIKQALGHEQGLSEDSFDSPAASAITRRILMQRADLLSKYGPEKVTAAIDEVADFVGDVEEIGSSDVSGWIKQVEQSLAGMGEEVAVTTGNPPLEETTALQGQYGHSGKLQTFDDVEEDVLHRLRELSGMIRS